MSIASDVFAHVIMINDDNCMVTTQKKRIVQRSKLIDNLWFLVKPDYNGFNMSEFTVLIEYLAPVSRKYRTEFLQVSESDYSGYLKYTMPVDTCITAEPGEVEFQITFLLTKLDPDGNSSQHVRKVTGGKLTVSPITAWSDIIPDSALTALDQRIIKTDAQIRALNDMNSVLYETKADGLIYDETSNALQLAAVGKAIGNKVTLNTSCESFKDGVPVVDFTAISGGTDTPSEDDNIVEF